MSLLPLRRAVGRALDALQPVQRWTARHHLARRTGICLVAVGGALVAVTLWGSVHQSVGPVQVSFAVQPRLHGGTEIDVPPLGRLRVASHAAPLHLKATVTGIDLTDAQRALRGEVSTAELERQVARDVRHALLVLVIKWTLLALLGGAAAVLLVYRRRRPALLGVSAVAIAVVASAVAATATWNTAAFGRPRFSGVLSSAPTLIGSVEDIPARFDTYRRELARIVTNISKLYDATSSLPSAIGGDAVPVLWVSDIHDNPEAFSVMQSVVSQFDVRAVVDTGDISDHGTAAENRIYDPVGSLGVPYIYVRGNHDSSTTQTYLRGLTGVRVLDDGASTTIDGIRFAGIGDPNFTPDRSVDYAAGDDALRAAGQRLAGSIDTAKAQGQTTDVALVHEPVMATPLDGHVPLVLDGHTHKRGHVVTEQTLTLTQGSTGGAGLRQLEGSEPLPLQMSVLYFDPTSHRLVAADDITISGLGAQSVQIQRHRASDYRTEQTPSTPTDPSGGSTSSSR